MGNPHRLLLLCLLLAAPASADHPSGLRYQLSEVGHRVTVRLDRGYATLIVRRTVANPGEKSDQALWQLRLPEGAVATALRTRGKDRWFEGELLEAEEAAARYLELTGIGGAYPKDPALLSWRDLGHLALQVFPVPPKGTLTLEYELTLPMEYSEGRYLLSLPPLVQSEPWPVVRFVAARPTDRLFMDDRRVRTGSTVRLDASAGEIELALEPRDVPRLSAEIVSSSTGSGRHLVRWEVAAAPRLSEVPAGAHLVVAIDVSRSRPAWEVEASAAAAAAWIRHFPRAQVQVLLFDRKVRPLRRGFGAVEDLLDDLRSLESQQGNGSQLDDALARADRLLAATPRPDARRVLVLTDLRTRLALSPEDVAPLMRRSGALVHFGVVEQGWPSVERDDASTWSTVLASTGGLQWTVRATPDEDAEEEMISAYEELARPLALDHFFVHGPGLHPQEIEVPERLTEGTATGEMVLQPDAVPYLSASGLLWTEPVEVMATPDAAGNARASAVLFGDPLHADLSEAEMMVLAMRGGAVSPVTSYLAIEPGVRPSTDGFDWGAIGSAFGTGGLGMRGVGRGGAGFAGHVSRFDHRAWLTTELEAAQRRCGVETAVRVELETTLAEIVDVLPPTAAAGDCFFEAVWALELPAEFRAERERWSLTLLAPAP